MAVKKVFENDEVLVISTNEDDMVPWTDDDMMLKNKLQILLKDNIMEIAFTKVNGEERTMKCTLKPTLIPEEHKPKGKRPSSHHLLSVWNVDENAWKSFRVHNVHDYIVLRSEA